jgi:hypothetical protein
MRCAGTGKISRSSGSRMNSGLNCPRTAEVGAAEWSRLARIYPARREAARTLNPHVTEQVEKLPPLLIQARTHWLNVRRGRCGKAVGWRRLSALRAGFELKLAINPGGFFIAHLQMRALRLRYEYFVARARTIRIRDPVATRCSRTPSIGVVLPRGLCLAYVISSHGITTRRYPSYRSGQIQPGQERFSR